MRRRVAPIVAAAAVMLLAGATASADVTVANIAPWSSNRPYSALGTLRGTELALEAVNAAGGLLGQKLRNAQIDDGCNSEQGLAAAKLAVASRPVLVMGGACSPAAVEIGRILAAAGILQIVPNAASHKVMEVGIPSILRMAGRGDNEGAFTASFIASRWADRRIAIIDDGSANWREASAAVAAGLERRGIRPALSARFESGRRNYDGLVRTLREQRIEMLYMNGIPPDLGLIARDIAGAGLKLEIVSGRTANADTFVQTAGAAADGILFPDRRDWRDAALADPILAAEKAAGGEINVFVLSAYVAMQVWVEAVTAAGSFDAAAVAASAKSRSFSTIFGDLAFDAHGDLTPESEQWTWYRWRGGKMEPLPGTK
jgi:branched-chain amino acid transport system substrate-binding protein